MSMLRSSLFLPSPKSAPPLLAAYVREEDMKRLSLVFINRDLERVTPTRSLLFSLPADVHILAAIVLHIKAENTHTTLKADTIFSVKSPISKAGDLLKNAGTGPELDIKNLKDAQKFSEQFQTYLEKAGIPFPFRDALISRITDRAFDIAKREEELANC